MTSSTQRMPVFFVSHGGPNLLDDNEYPYDEPVAKGLRAIGDQIKALKPRGMVIISGHWEAGRNSLQVNSKSAIPQPLIYDFYNFPAWMYREQFEHKVDPALTQRVVELVAQKNIEIEAVDRGLDHGVWVVMKKAGLADAGFPITQLSLYKSDSMEDHVRLGELLQPLRDEGIVVVGSGMAVHNLRDLFGPGGSRSGGVRPYVAPFDKQIDEAVLGDGAKRRDGVLALAKSELLRKAHPTLEHLMPLHVAVGAAGPGTKGTKLVHEHMLSLSWSCYRFE
ncbi:aromatic ring-opening dioxygenase LigB subunit [Linderina pennispora]|uniref:Aromatic ring-opening dioxygenase LigB subunit n=1 Tax=Linderina pennispora TaxID=61395 RepID=A0A1Y1W7T6_9FUNG|nr:aromatic ring-opening dioxygenase LigB subunit [Linderina pennispora]ORX69445.1 aromatic ring-opening dioxygenase LigB subunit [Linderina pennispora]